MTVGAHSNLVGLGKALKGETGTSAADSAAVAASTGPLARAEALALLREDYDQSYFVSGKGSMAAYASDCTFADPFVAFDGVRRFQANVANLGGLMEDIDLKITKWEETDEALETAWRFSCVLALPWRPKLAAAGGTTHVFDEASGRVVKHVERWDVEPGKVVKELLCVRIALKCPQMLHPMDIDVWGRPAAKFPTSKAEVIMMSVAEGDVKGVWFELSPYLFKASAPVVAAGVLLQAATGGSLDGLLGGLQQTAEVLLVLTTLTEIIKLVGQLGL